MYDAFISYNSRNRQEASEIGAYLENQSLHVFLDFDVIIPGQNHQEKIDTAVAQSACVVVLIGQEGLGPWQRSEVDQAIWDSIKAHKYLIPVVLPGASIAALNVPGHLKTLSYVEFGSTIGEPEKISQLQQAIIAYSSIMMSSMHPFSAKEIAAHMESTRDAYDDDRFAREFYETWKREIPGAKLDQFLRKLRKKSRILDAGCGPGHHADYMQKAGYDVIGIDFANEPLKIARREFPQSRFRKHDMTNLEGLDDVRYDGIWACASCVHIHKEHFVKQLWEFNRIIRPGGFLGLTILVHQHCHLDKYKRFFEEWSSLDELLRHVTISKFDISEISVEHVETSTEGDKRISDWATILCQRPLSLSSS